MELPVDAGLLVTVDSRGGGHCYTIETTTMPHRVGSGLHTQASFPADGSLALGRLRGDFEDRVSGEWPTGAKVEPEPDRGDREAGGGESPGPPRAEMDSPYVPASSFPDLCCCHFSGRAPDGRREPGASQSGGAGAGCAGGLWGCSSWLEKRALWSWGVTANIKVPDRHSSKLRD